MDLYLINTVMNGLWYFFTIVFLLYRFTTFFTHLYNTVQVCFRLFNGVRTFISYWKNNRMYDEIYIETAPPTFFGRLKKSIKRMYRFVFNNNENHQEEHMVNIFEEHQSSNTFQPQFPQPQFPQPQESTKSSLLDKQYNNKNGSPSNYFQSISLHPMNECVNDFEEESHYYNAPEDDIMHSSIFTKKKHVNNDINKYSASSLSQRLETRPLNLIKNNSTSTMFESTGITTKFIKDPHENNQPNLL